jgi:microcompartment protein CcmK/EutM
VRIAKVVGNVVSTIKDETYCGYKLMIIEYRDESGRPSGARQIAFDGGQAGIGDVVLVSADGGAANMLLDKEIIADLTICGVLDSCTYDGETSVFS